MDLYLIIIIVIILLLLFIYNKTIEEFFTEELTYLNIPFKYNNDPSSSSYNYIDYKDGAIVVPNASVYVNRNLYNII